MADSVNWVEKGAVTKIKDQEIQKSDDRLEWNSVIGKKAQGYWYYSAFLNFKTQFTDDLDIEENPFDIED